MRRLLYVALVVAGPFLVACRRATPPVEALRIVFDDWWNVDYVKNGCVTAARGGEPCSAESTPEDVVREFEDDLEVAFASESACHGMSLVHFTPEMASQAVRNPNAPAKSPMAKTIGAQWTFMLDLDGRSRTQAGQGWALVDSTNHLYSGRITRPNEVMQQVCNIVRGVGGKAEN
jgi:hypothetical protein